MLGKITQIKEVGSLNLGNVGALNGSKGARLGMSGMISALSDYTSYDGYLVETTEHKYHILIDNGQSCCENWGYMTSEDDLKDYIGTELREVRLTDTALNQAKIDEDFYYGGNIQFVDFVTDNGVFQIAVRSIHKWRRNKKIFRRVRKPRIRRSLKESTDNNTNARTRTICKYGTSVL